MKEVSLRRGKREISPVPRLAWNNCKHERVDSKERQERSHQFLVSHGTAENEQDESREREREISPVPGLSWNS